MNSVFQISCFICGLSVDCIPSIQTKTIFHPIRKLAKIHSVLICLSPLPKNQNTFKVTFVVGDDGRTEKEEWFVPERPWCPREG